jgi:molecular chaperone HtpG
MNEQTSTSPQILPFKAETHQLLEILIHSLYTDRDVFLRELISNASDALTRMSFEMLTNHDVLDPEAELAIWITVDAEKKTLTLRDTGIGMNMAELADNLGTIAHSGARAFLQAARESNANIADIIGQFGVGFYSAFMVAESITVTSRSYRQEDQAASWTSTGTDTFSLEPGTKDDRGTEIVIKLKEDAAEYADEYRLKSIIKKHSEYISYPIYVGENKEQANQLTAIWRKPPRQVTEQEYKDFYRQYTLETEEPIAYAHLSVDAPVQLSAILFIPASPERSIFSPRKQEGLKLFARNVLIQEFCKDLLPEYFNFVQGIVDSEDLPLNVSRESVQSNRVMAQLKKFLTSKTIDALEKKASETPVEYEKFWKMFSRHIKEGLASDADTYTSLLPLLRFHSIEHPEQWVSLDQYIQEMKPGQEKIYYILGEEDRSAMHSPHLEVFRKYQYDVLLMTDPLDPFMLLRMEEYKDHSMANVSSEDLKLPAPESGAEEPEPKLSTEEAQSLVEKIKAHLSGQVFDVRTSDRLVESAARLVDADGGKNAELQRVYKMLNREFEAPQKVLEINTNHPILVHLSHISEDQPLFSLVVDQIFEDALLIEGLHPDPAGMIGRIQKIIESALDKAGRS